MIHLNYYSIHFTDYKRISIRQAYYQNDIIIKGHTTEIKVLLNQAIPSIRIPFILTCQFWHQNKIKILQINRKSQKNSTDHQTYYLTMFERKYMYKGYSQMWITNIKRILHIHPKKQTNNNHFNKKNI